MGHYFAKIIISGILLLCMWPLGAQERVVDETEISFTILKWHFHHYPMSETEKWIVAGDTYRVYCVKDGVELVVDYNESGNRLKETADLTREIPVTLTYYLDNKYSKYKIQLFERKTDFRDDSVKYEMLVKSKERGDELLHFDGDLIPIGDKLITTTH